MRGNERADELVGSSAMCGPEGSEGLSKDWTYRALARV